ncbi:hypothetical protein F4604DRAFT_1921075 [Suillus subluteus]|nr:hypothetical protein F4604DRAFT_1921075 [Suillus subluteus]
MTGDRVAHPLLISLANIRMSTRLKVSSGAFLLTALLPVPKFTHKKKHLRGVLEDRLIHQCLDIVLAPLKQAAREGVMLSDPVGHSRYCFTPLTSYIIDTPEAMMLATVGGKMSPVTMASYKQFGDPFLHKPRTRSTTFMQLAVIREKVDPNNIEVFFHEAQKFHLNKVDKPFWLDWIMAEPSHFLTPEFLHHLHREFYDHNAKWIICAVGEAEIDFHFSVLQPVMGFHHFHSGISKLKQVTGRAQHDIQHSIIAVTADAVPSAVITAVRALMDFRYLVQSTCIDDHDIERISTVLAEFHANKQAIIDAGFHRGKGGKVIDNWYIQKIELMQSIVPSIHNTGVVMQWTADTMEHTHVTDIKDPAQSSNNNNYDAQICHHLDCADKCHCFELAMSLLDLLNQHAYLDEYDDNINLDIDIDDDRDHPVDLLATTSSPGYSRPITDYFAIAQTLLHKEVGTIPWPLRTFIVGQRIAVHLAYDPLIRALSVNDTALNLTFLTYGQLFLTSFVAKIPTEMITSTQLDMDIHDASIVQPAQTLNCAPPCDLWTSGQYDTVIVNHKGGYSWPTDGLHGHSIAQIKLIICPIGKRGTEWSWKDRFLTYVERFDIGNREPNTQLHLLKRAKWSNGTWIGDIIPVTQLRAPVNIVPHFGASADNHLTLYNSNEHLSEFWLNRYWDKNTFFPLLM